MSQSLVEQALAEAYATAPQDIIILDTLEVHHRTFNEPMRVVRWPITGEKPDTFHLLLDREAPVNPGEIVDFLGVPFELKPPDQSSENIGTFEIRIDGIDDLVDEYMENAAIDGGKLTAIYRTYVQGMEAEGPSSVWSGLELQNPRIEGLAFVIDASVLNWAVRPYGRLYTALEYPGLVVGR